MQLQPLSGFGRGIRVPCSGVSNLKCAPRLVRATGASWRRRLVALIRPQDTGADLQAQAAHSAHQAPVVAIQNPNKQQKVLNTKHVIPRLARAASASLRKDDIAPTRLRTLTWPYSLRTRSSNLSRNRKLGSRQLLGQDALLLALLSLP